MKKYYFYLFCSLALMVIFLLALFFWMNRPVERYGVLSRSSTSGDMRFSYYDTEKKKVLDSWHGYPWFFATIKDLKNEKAVGNYYEYVQDNQNSVFRITGKKERDDCEYYNTGVCLENIVISDIEVVFEKTTDIEKSIVECKSGERYSGKTLVEKGINWRLIGTRIFYEGEELQRLCDPELKEYTSEMTPNYRITPDNQI